MANNITAPAAGAVLATDEIGGVHYPRSKVSFGANGSATDVSPDAPLPVVAALPAGASSAANQAAIIAALATIAGYVDNLETLTGQQATAAKQDTAQTSLTAIVGHVDGIEALLGTLGTQATLAAILAKLIAAPATEAKQDAMIALSTLPAGTDRSGSITAGGTAQNVAGANANRKSLVIQNISDVDMWVNEIGAAAAADTSGSWKVAAGSVFAVSTNRAVSIIAATTGKKFTATEI